MGWAAGPLKADVGRGFPRWRTHVVLAVGSLGLLTRW